MSEFDSLDLVPDTIESEVKKTAYDKYVVLNVKEIANLCKLIEPLTKSSIDELGKCVYFSCVDEEFVEVRYYNNPYVIVGKVANQSGVKIKDFAILVSTLKNLLTNCYENFVLVEKDDEINLVFDEQLIYIETRNVRKEAYSFVEKAVTGTIDTELASYVFKVVGSILSQTERASEKVIVVKDGVAVFNTGVFAASIKSPFSGNEELVVYKQASDSIAVISDSFRGAIQYGVDNVLVVKTDTLYAEFPVGVGERVKAFISPSTQVALQFNASVVVNDESLYRLVKLVQSLDYLSDLAKVGFDGSDMVFELSVENQSRKFLYKFPVVEGKTEVCGDMAIATNILRVFLDIVGDKVKYSFTDMGLGIKNELGVFLVRKS